jgi:putative transposase
VALARQIIQFKKFKLKEVCRVLGISRSNLYRNPQARPSRYRCTADTAVLEAITVITQTRGTYGYRRITAIINRQRRLEPLALWNRKRIFRVMKMKGLGLQKSISPQPKRPHLGQVSVSHSNVRYCSDIFEVRCWNDEKLWVAFTLDCCDREALSFIAHPRPLLHDDIIQLMDQTVIHRFGDALEKLPSSIQWLSDRGPQYNAFETYTYGAKWGFDVRTTPSYSPESSGIAEAFVKTLKRDYVYVNDLDTADSVLRNLPEWFADYNSNHPHSAFAMKSPLEYRMEKQLIQ